MLVGMQRTNRPK